MSAVEFEIVFDGRQELLPAREERTCTARLHEEWWEEDERAPMSPFERESPAADAAIAALPPLVTREPGPGSCGCGCGETLPGSSGGRPPKFVAGHWLRSEWLVKRLGS